MGELGSARSGGAERWRGSAPPDPSSLNEERLSVAEEAAQQVLNCIHPTLDSEEKRRDIIDYLQRLIKSHLNCEVFTYGSVPLKTYLPDGDIDLTAIECPRVDDSLVHNVYSLLQREENNENAEFQFKETQFIDAEVKLVKCLVQNLVIDISFNQLGGISTLCFLEQVDRLVGRNHLFKRSIILIKAWCYYESRILGAHHGLISTYALEILVLYIFHLFHSSLCGPLAVLYRFLEYYSQFDWENYCISLKGPVCKSSLPEIVGNFYRIRSAFKYGARKLGQVLSQPSNKIALETREFFANTVARHGNDIRNNIQHSALEFGDEESSTSLSSPVELFPGDDNLIKSYASYINKDSVEPAFKNDRELSWEMGSDSCYSTEGVATGNHIAVDTYDDLSRSNPNTVNGTPDYASSNNYSTSVSWNNYYQPFFYSSNLSAEIGSLEAGNHISLDFRDMDLKSVGGESEAFNPLAELSGDYDSHIRSLLYGQLCHGFSLYASSGYRSPSVPPEIENGKPWDIVCQSIPFLQSQFSRMNFHPKNIFMEKSACLAADSAMPAYTFPSEGTQKTRGTGTFFPQVNVFCKERPSYGRIMNKLPGSCDQFSRYGSSDGSSFYSGSKNNLENDIHDFQPAKTTSQGCGPVGKENQMKGDLRGSYRIEFGSIGCFVYEFSDNIMGSTMYTSSEERDIKGVVKQDRIAGQSIHLKNDAEYPPLWQ